jgi:hypothetical protein
VANIIIARYARPTPSLMQSSPSQVHGSFLDAFTGFPFKVNQKIPIFMFVLAQNRNLRSILIQKVL